jgi:hypothetical protein
VQNTVGIDKVPAIDARRVGLLGADTGDLQKGWGEDAQGDLSWPRKLEIEAIRLLGRDGEQQWRICLEEAWRAPDGQLQQTTEYDPYVQVITGNRRRFQERSVIDAAKAILGPVK